MTQFRELATAYRQSVASANFQQLVRGCSATKDTVELIALSKLVKLVTAGAGDSGGNSVTRLVMRCLD